MVPPAAGAQPDLDLWVSHLPIKEIEGIDFWEAAAVAERIQELLPLEDKRFFDECDVMAPVRKKGGYFLLFRCLPHDCGAQQVVVVIRGTDGPIAVAFHRDPLNGPSSVRFFAEGFASGFHRDGGLPPELLQELLMPGRSSERFPSAGEDGR